MGDLALSTSGAAGSGITLAAISPVAGTGAVISGSSNLFAFGASAPRAAVAARAAQAQHGGKILAPMYPKS
nr:hypothetical protein [Pseudarthrobacter psychrotolerans]